MNSRQIKHWASHQVTNNTEISSRKDKLILGFLFGFLSSFFVCIKKDLIESFSGCKSYLNTRLLRVIGTSKICKQTICILLKWAKVKSECNYYRNSFNEKFHSLLLIILTQLCCLSLLMAASHTETQTADVSHTLINDNQAVPSNTQPPLNQSGPGRPSATGTLCTPVTSAVYSSWFKGLQMIFCLKGFWLCYKSNIS